jgi:dienelactone hydrolase
MAEPTRGGITRRHVLRAGGASFAGYAVGVDKALAQAIKTDASGLYPGAGHAFLADDRPSFNAAAAADGWKRCTAFLDRTLKT